MKLALNYLVKKNMLAIARLFLNMRAINRSPVNFYTTRPESPHRSDTTETINMNCNTTKLSKYFYENLKQFH